jgi:ribonuclease VapC
MVVDSSALLAVFFLEPEAGRFVAAMRAAPRPLISAANLLETSIVLDARVQADASAELDQFIADVGLEVEPVTRGQVEVARRAYRLWGKGYHPAALNFGDCFAYALARTTGLPLLYKGDDFPQTDIEPA